MTNFSKVRGKFSREALPSIINYYSIQDINLKGCGDWRDAVCPFHADTKPSLRVNIKHGGFRCMACGAHGGDILDFQMQRHNVNFINACKQLCAWVEGSPLKC